jgi:hypothetical protein
MAGATVGATIEYRDVSNNLIYSETHAGGTNSQGNFVFKVGRGAPVAGSINAQRYKDVTKLNYTLDVTYNGNNKLLTGMEEVCAVAKANAAMFACNAGIANNALALVGWNIIIIPITWTTILCPDEPDLFDYYPVFRRENLSRAGESDLTTVPLRSIVRQDYGMHINDQQDIPYIRIGAGLGKPMYCGPDPDEISAMHGIRMTNLHGLNYGVGLWVDNYDAAAATFALAAYNANTLGIGMRAVGGNTGLAAYGKTGMYGQSIGTGNGASVFGYIGNAADPDPNAFKYAVAAQVLSGLSFAYAVAMFGTSFTTGPIMTMSDAQLKTEIRTTRDALERVKHLRPASYTYVQNTSYGLPEGIQHGFIAQELEQEFPELVGDIVVPNTLDYDHIGTSETSTYRGINYEGLVPILTAAIQELNTTVEEQSTEIVYLKHTLAELEKRISAIEK